MPGQKSAALFCEREVTIAASGLFLTSTLPNALKLLKQFEKEAPMEKKPGL